MISTKPPHTIAFVGIRKTTPSGERIIELPLMVDYSKRRQGQDLSNQLSTYYTCLRRSIKWYQKMAFELVFGEAVLRSNFIYKENHTTNNITVAGS